MEGSEEKTLSLDMIPVILDFIETPKSLGESMSLGERNGAVSDYYEFSVNRSLGEVLDLAYNPDLPSNLTLFCKAFPVDPNWWSKHDFTQVFS